MNDEKTGLIFDINHISALPASDDEITELLRHVYVDGGFTSSEVAEKIFAPAAVRNRGFLLTARVSGANEFAGMIIVVPPTSKAIARAKANECEIHLLGVKPEFRGQGLGRDLVAKAINHAETNQWSKIILWTQKSMLAAQTLYASFHFQQTNEMSKNGIEFLVYEKTLS
ncbi:MAG: GNAT family N-acetyltransferase [Gammaproteobacteria bacterium]|nr:GNAT family N-acetyltransferase [Gammaproteobacteria bacterium]MDH5650357.1 GNAT family N-acetyltransferase [Gammaproteobacteria bacterium]